MHDAERIREVLRRMAFDQAGLAKAAGVSQSTVSRALAGGEPVRRGRAHRQLMAYVNQHSDAGETANIGTTLVTAAFEKIWDGSDIHAAVVAQIIEDLDGLTPSLALRKRFGVRKRT